MIDATGLPAVVAWDGDRRGFDLVAVHRDAVTRARVLKPGIPSVVDGIVVRHELELEIRF